MKNLKIFLIIIFIQISYTQSNYKTVENLEKQWGDYAIYQKEELLSFIDFLFQQKEYEKCILAAFRYNFLYPEDELIGETYFFIGRCYEELRDFDKAIEYFEKSQKLANRNSSLFKSNQYRKSYVKLIIGEFQFINKVAEISKDPYLVTFNGFANFNELKFDEAKKEFNRAKKLFKSKNHRKNLSILMRACDNVKKLPNLNPTRAALYGIFPGGGRVYLKEYRQAIATFSSIVFLGINLSSDSKTTFMSSWIPRLGFSIIYGGSIYGSYKGIEEANRQRETRYIKRVQRKYNSLLFVDFPEPKTISNKP